jgi:ABC-2 type transport system permease protein
VNGLAMMARTELRLFRREPFSMVFVLAFPLMMMLLLSAVFGNDQAEASSVENGMLIWRGVTPTNYYTAASVASVVAALGLMTLPINLAGYRERGILRRMRASSVPAWVVITSQLTLSIVTFVAGAVVMTVVARFASGAMLPDDPIGVLVALLVGALTFGSIGLLLAAVVRTSRAAQGIGLMLFFGLWLISGTAPPRAVLPAGLRDVGLTLPLGQLVVAIQDPWFGNGWAFDHLAILLAYALATGLPALWFFRWD